MCSLQIFLVSDGELRGVLSRGSMPAGPPPLSASHAGTGSWRAFVHDPGKTLAEATMSVARPRSAPPHSPGCRPNPESRVRSLQHSLGSASLRSAGSSRLKLSRGGVTLMRLGCSHPQELRHVVHQVVLDPRRHAPRSVLSLTREDVVACRVIRHIDSLRPPW